MSNPHEERNRHIKAYKLHRVMLGVLHRNPELTLRDVRDAGRGTRITAARIARVRVPSDETWAMMCDMVEEELRFREVGRRPK